MEEINFQPASSLGGENYGWSFYEGTLPFKFPPGREVPGDLVFPILTYSHSVGRSITGGEVMRGALTNRMHGVYLFSDFISGHFGALKRIGASWARADFGVLLNPAQQRLQVSSFGQDEDGNIYALEMLHNQGAGIFRLRDLNQVHAPRFSITNGTYTTSQTVQLSSLSPGARIHYTLDGTDPTETSLSLSPGDTLTVSETSTVKARAYRPDLLPSPISTLRVTMLIAFTITPPFGPVTNGTTITINASASNAVIRYTLDGTPPTDQSPLYTNAFTLNGNETLTVIATKDGWTSGSTNIFFVCCGAIKTGQP